jgi:hypothetical protein
MDASNGETPRQPMPVKLSLKSAPIVLLILAASLCGSGEAQATPDPGAVAAAATPDAERPLPDVNALMHQVETNERKSETIQHDYLYLEANTLENRDSHDAVKKTESREIEVFWLNGVQVVRTLKKDGKELSPDEIKKENERIDEQVKKAKERREKADSEGKETDSRGHDEITLARILELGSFSNERRELVNGRPTIVVDYAGDPKAKTHNYAEGFFRELAGTVWVDEQDQAIQHVEGHVDHDFHIGGGLVVNVKKGTWFKASFAKINDEVWLPQAIEGDGHARYLLFLSLNGHFAGHTSDYRKFKATSTVLPGLNRVDPEVPLPAETPATKPPPP